MIIRCDSAAMVAKTSELLPEPDTPVKTVSRRFGSSTLTSLRLFSRAPCTRIRSWLSAACCSSLRSSSSRPCSSSLPLSQCGRTLLRRSRRRRASACGPRSRWPRARPAAGPAAAPGTRSRCRCAGPSRPGRRRPRPAPSSSPTSTERSRTASIITTSRVGPTASRAWPDAVRLRRGDRRLRDRDHRPLVHPGQRHGTRCAAPAAEPLATQTSIAGVAQHGQRVGLAGLRVAWVTARSGPRSTSRRTRRGR